MKKLVLFILIAASVSASFSQSKAIYNDSLKTALIMIDIQDFYFDEARSPLTNRFEATENTKKLLDLFREKGFTVIHVQHKSNSPIRDLVKPIGNEKVVTKEHVNAFIDTDLEEYLKSVGAEQLVICGMMTQMCVEGTVRAAADLDYKVIVPGDACATRDLKYDDVIIPAEMVHASSLQSFAFGGYAKIDKTEDLIQKMK